jgi:hypothetical protein
MANLIRLKQIESGDALSVAANVGSDFSASVQTIVSQSLDTQFSQSIVNIVVNNVGAILPDGLVSSSAQIEFNQIVGVTDFSSSLYSTRTALVSQVASVYTALDSRVDSLEVFSSSLNNTYATDIELATTTSNLSVDMGEF